MGKLTDGYSFDQSFQPLDETKCLLQTRVDVLTRRSFFQSCVSTTSAAFYRDVVNDKMKHLYHAQISWNNPIHNKTNP